MHRNLGRITILISGWLWLAWSCRRESTGLASFLARGESWRVIESIVDHIYKDGSFPGRVRRARTSVIPRVRRGIAHGATATMIGRRATKKSTYILVLARWRAIFRHRVVERRTVSGVLPSCCFLGGAGITGFATMALR